MLLAMTGIGVGCGEVSFVPSPFTPQNVDLVYSSQEDITVVRWRISSTVPADPNLQFQILGDGGFQTIDFLQSVYPGGGIACTDGQGSCFQYVLRGRYATWNGGRPVQAVHSFYGVLPGAIAREKPVAQTLAVASFFHSGNQQITVNITDQVAAPSNEPYLYPRGYDHSMWPTNGLCVSDSAPDGVSFLPLDPTTDGFGPDTQPDGHLTDSGIYCVAVRPVPNDAGAAAVAQTRIETLPEVVTLHQTFAPPVELSPVIYQIVFDLQIPLADRCTSAIQTIESLVDKYMNKGNATVPVTKLPTLNLAVDPHGTDASANCNQQDGPLPASDMADAVMQAVTSYPEQYQQFHFLFFDNLDAPLSGPLTDSLSTFFSALQTAPSGYNLRTISWLFNPGLAAYNSPTPTWSMTQPPWQAADDPSFEHTLASYVMQNLPYESQTHDPSTPVALLSPDDAMTDDGDQIKICQSAPAVIPVDVNSGNEFFGPSWPVKAADPPGYLVNLNPSASAGYSSFVPVSATVDYQICSRYCDNHPYVSTARQGQSSWSGSYACAETTD
jgi:hypothetical protein